MSANPASPVRGGVIINGPVAAATADAGSATAGREGTGVLFLVHLLDAAQYSLNRGGLSAPAAV